VSCILPLPIRHLHAPRGQEVRVGGGDTGKGALQSASSGAAERSSGAEAAHRHAAEMNLCIDGVQRG